MVTAKDALHETLAQVEGWKERSAVAELPMMPAMVMCFRDGDVDNGELPVAMVQVYSDHVEEALAMVTTAVSGGLQAGGAVRVAALCAGGFHPDVLAMAYELAPIAARPGECIVVQAVDRTGTVLAHRREYRQGFGTEISWCEVADHPLDDISSALTHVMTDGVMREDRYPDTPEGRVRNDLEVARIITNPDGVLTRLGFPQSSQAMLLAAQDTERWDMLAKFSGPDVEKVDL